MPTAVWRDERAASMRYIARSCWEKGDTGQARDWYLRAITEAPHLREPYMDLARMLYALEEWEGVLYFTACALAVTVRPRSYICEAEAWGSLPHDLRAMAYYYLGNYPQALEEAGKAAALEPENQRLRENQRWLERRVLEDSEGQNAQFLKNDLEEIDKDNK